MKRHNCLHDKMLYLPRYILLTLMNAVLLQEIAADDFNFDFKQNDYKIKFERSDVASFNKDYVHSFKVATFKYNRTCTAFNFTFHYKIDLDKYDILIQAYKFASNEYRMFPIRLQAHYCTVFEKNMAGFGDFTKCRNFEGCPQKKEKVYSICNFTPDESKFPPLIPSGRYMVEVTGLYHTTEIWVARGYAEVYRPFKGK